MRKFMKVIILFCFITICFSILNPMIVSAIPFWERWWDDSYEDRIYREPRIQNTTPGDDLGDLINDAESFENQQGASVGMSGGTEFKIDTNNLQKFSSNLYTIFMTIAVAVCVIVGTIIGFKFMNGSIETQVETKKLLKPYLIGCVVVFGAFGIWSLAVNILSGF